MKTTTNDIARCTIRGHRVEVRRNRTEAATYNVGIDGWLVAVAPTAEDAVWEVAEKIRMKAPQNGAPKVPRRFCEAVAAL